MSEKIIGIDLGTTNSCVAIMNGDKAEVLEDRQASWMSSRITPSLVFFPKDGKECELVGESAIFEGLDELPNSPNLLHLFKRIMGRRFDDEKVQRHSRKVPYNIVRADNDDAWVEINGKHRSPPEISARVLREMKRIAEDHLLGKEVKSAVITVPAHFNDSQRQATKDAGRIAGLDVKRIIDEPTAAALAYGMDKWRKGSKIAVYDLGGGTFDISIIEMTEIGGERRIEVKSTNGNTFLGGADFDDCIIEHICGEFKKEKGMDPRDIEDQYARGVTLLRLKEAAEKAKKQLSRAPQAVIRLDNITSGPRDLKMKLTRSDLEILVEDLISQTVKPCQIAMKDADISPTDIDEVILVGGQTRMPKVQEVVRSIFGKEPRWGVNPDEAVALGAAIQGGILAGDVKGTNLENPRSVTSHSLGVEINDGEMMRLIDKHTLIPVKRSHNFTTVVRNQKVIQVNVLEGEDNRANNNKLLGYFDLDGILPGKPGVPRIEVSFNMDADKILTASAKDMDTGNERSIRIIGQGLSEQEIDRMQKMMMPRS